MGSGYGMGPGSGMGMGMEGGYGMDMGSGMGMGNGMGMGSGMGMGMGSGMGMGNGMGMGSGMGMGFGGLGMGMDMENMEWPEKCRRQCIYKRRNSSDDTMFCFARSESSQSMCLRDDHDDDEKFPFNNRAYGRK